MSFEWLESLSPRPLLSWRARLLWFLFLALFPLAYFGGTYLEMIEDRPARVKGALDRAMSIRAAEQFAESKGVSVSDWKSYVIVEDHDDLLRYYAAKSTDRMEASGLAPAREVTVLFRSPNGVHEFRTYLALTGQVTGFDMGKGALRGKVDVEAGGVNIKSDSSDEAKSAASSEADKGQAEAIARQYLAANQALQSLVKLGTPESVDENSEDPRRMDVRWDVKPPQQPELTLKVQASVRDSKVIAERITADLDSDYAKNTLPKKSRFPVVLNSIYGLFLTLSTLYAIFRYAKRTLQKEVSHVRTLVVAGLFCISYTIYVYSIAYDQVAVRVDAEKLSTILLPSAGAAVLAFGVLGLLVGLGYGSGEGEVREAYPGKLTSLDALLAGRLFSRNVALSMLYGSAIAGWLMLGQHVIWYFLKPDMLGARSEGLEYTFARLPWLSLIAGRQYRSLLIAVAGLLLPAALLVRRKSKGKRRYFWLALFALCSVMHDAASYPTVLASLLAMGVLASALLVPFFTFDLLAAMVSLSALAFVNELARLSAVFPSWIELSWLWAVVGTASIVYTIYFALYGNEVDEEEVRPKYAKNLAERMGLQAEVEAAREAQLRLMPQGAPDVSGFEVAALCIPAKVVGGDFYDFFPLDGGRLGVFVAQGSDRGLASALSIAMAKGILMHAAETNNSALQVILTLESSMAKLLQSDVQAAVNFVYGVIDTKKQTLSYARIGSSPRVSVHRNGSGFAKTEMFERMARLPGRPADSPSVYEGEIELGLRDYLIVFTDGVSSVKLKRFRSKTNQWLEAFAGEVETHAGNLQNLLISSLSRQQDRARDDLTAVVLKSIEVQAAVRKVVA